VIHCKVLCFSNSMYETSSQTIFDRHRQLDIPSRGGQTAQPTAEARGFKRTKLLGRSSECRTSARADGAAATAYEGPTPPRPSCKTSPADGPATHGGTTSDRSLAGPRGCTRSTHTYT